MLRTHNEYLIDLRKMMAIVTKINMMVPPTFEILTRIRWFWSTNVNLMVQKMAGWLAGAPALGYISRYICIFFNLLFHNSINRLKKRDYYLGGRLFCY